MTATLRSLSDDPPYSVTVKPQKLLLRKPKRDFGALSWTLAFLSWIRKSLMLNSQSSKASSLSSRWSADSMKSSTWLHSWSCVCCCMLFFMSS